MSKKQALFNICFVIGVVGLAIPLVQRAMVIARANGTPTPYTVTLKQTVRDAQGKLLTHETSTINAVRGDGSRSITNSESRSTGTDISRSVHLASGNIVDVGDQFLIRTTWHRPTPNIADWHRDPSRNCSAAMSGKPIRSRKTETVVGEEYLGNIRTVKITHDNNAEWFAIDVGCAMVKASYDFGNGGINEHVLISLTAGEPAQALFSTEGREVGPAEFQNIRRKTLAINCSAACVSEDQGDNDRYLLAMKAQP